MSDLATIIAAEVQRQASSEAVQAHIAKKVEESVKSAIDSALRWGDINKQIDEAVTTALALPDHVDLPSYSHMVLTLVRQILDERLETLLQGRVSEQLTELLAIGRSEVKLSELLDEIRKEFEEDYDRHGTHFTAVIEAAYPDSSYLTGYKKISLDEAPKMSPRECGARIHLTLEGHISSLYLSGQDVGTSPRLFGVHGWRRTLFALYVTKGRLIIDDESPSTYIGED